LVESESPFSRIGQLHYEFYSDENSVKEKLKNDPNIQCIVSKHDTDFGGAQCPEVCDYADGVDTIAFLLNLG
jgi:hypothetical protein